MLISSVLQIGDIFQTKFCQTYEKQAYILFITISSQWDPKKILYGNEVKVEILVLISQTYRKNTQAWTPQRPRPITLFLFCSPHRLLPMAFLATIWKLNQRQKVHSGFRNVQAWTDSTGLSCCLWLGETKITQNLWVKEKKNLYQCLLNLQYYPHQRSYMTMY